MAAPDAHGRAYVTVNLRFETKTRLLAQGDASMSADEVVTKILDELDAVKSPPKGRNGGRPRADTPAAP